MSSSMRLYLAEGGRLWRTALAVVRRHVVARMPWTICWTLCLVLFVHQLRFSGMRMGVSLLGSPEPAETASSYGTSDRRHPYRLFSTRTAYNVVRGKGEVKPIEGCKPVHLYMLVRHGSRFPGHEDIEAMDRILHPLRDTILKNAKLGLGSLDDRQLEKLRMWKLGMDPRNDLALSEAGKRDLEDIAKRYHQRFPELLNLSDPDIQLLFSHSDKPHAKASAQTFVDSLANVSGCGNFEQGTQNPCEFRRTLESTPADQDRVLLFCDTCDKYKEVHSWAYNEREHKKFLNGSKMDESLNSVRRRLGLSPKDINLDILDLIYDVCKYDFALLDNDAWCDVFSRRNLKTLEYSQDIKYYWRYGYGLEINYKQTCLLVKDILNSLSKATRSRSRSSVIRMGHSRTILPLYARLGIFLDDMPIISENIEHLSRRKWRLSYINPFMSNLVFVLYDCIGEFKVRTFINEREVKLPRCLTKLCPLNTLLFEWGRYGYDCDFDSICTLDDR